MPTPRLILLMCAFVGGAVACTSERTAGADAGKGSGHGVAAPPAEPEAPDTTGGSTIRHWQCAETGVASRIDAEGRTRLFLSGRTHAPGPDATAPATNSEAGPGIPVRFGQADGTATLEFPGDPPVACEPTARPSPWFDAANRGVTLRGIGNEPGWLVEVRNVATPSLHAELDYGQAVLDLSPVSPGAIDGAPWTATTPDGRTVTLTATRTICRDGMSGERFEAEVELRVGDRTYSGCGASLEDFGGFVH